MPLFIYIEHRATEHSAEWATLHTRLHYTELVLFLEPSTLNSMGKVIDFFHINGGKSLGVDLLFGSVLFGYYEKRKKDLFST